MNASCEIIKDLLPLYHDGVCSEESRALVDAHLKECSKCREELKQYDEDNRWSSHLDEAKLLRETAKTWKKNKKEAFFNGALIIAMLACISCVITYNAIGSYVTPDGLLVEPFGFIPLAWLFGFLSVIFAICLLLSRKRKKGR